MTTENLPRPHAVDDYLRAVATFCEAAAVMRAAHAAIPESVRKGLKHPVDVFDSLRPEIVLREQGKQE
jgi:hypothetical protein